MQKLRARRDVVLVDQRGTGQSNPLRCDDLYPTPQAVFNDMPMLDKLAACPPGH
jgi:pimeloyl-ACP methyl ester carboxylesterase